MRELPVAAGVATKRSLGSDFPLLGLMKLHRGLSQQLGAAALKPRVGETAGVLPAQQEQIQLRRVLHPPTPCAELRNLPLLRDLAFRPNLPLN